MITKIATKLCDDCAHRHNGFDFCPNYWRLLQLAKKRGSF